MKNKKKLISLYSMIVGTLLVVAGLFSFGVYAALNFNATTNGILNYTDKVCYIKGETDSDNVYYPSLNSALASVTDGGTICVFKDVTMGANITITKNVTIQGVYQDSNINMGANSIIVNQGKTLNLGGGDKILTVTGSKTNSGTLINNGTLTLNQRATISNTSTDTANTTTAVDNKGTLTVNGATINDASSVAISNSGTLTVSSNSTSISGRIGILTASTTAKTNISGATISGTQYSVYSNIASGLNISGGTFSNLVEMKVTSSSTPANTNNTITGGTFNGGLLVSGVGVRISGAKIVNATGNTGNAIVMDSNANVFVGQGANIQNISTTGSTLTLSSTPTISLIKNNTTYTSDASVALLIEDTYAPTTKAKIEFPLDGNCNYIAKYTGSKNASASIFDSSIISASGKYLKTRGFTTTVVDNGGSLKGNIKTYYPSSKSQSVAIGENKKTGSTLTGYTVAWADTTHSATLPTATTSALTIPATTYGNISLTPTWNTHTYTIKYNGNGSTGGSTANSTHTYGVAKELTANGYTKTGYTFAGWATSANGAVVYKDKQSVTSLTAENGATIELFAKWTANKYKVRYYDTYANTTTYTEVEYTYDNSTLKFPNGSLDSFTFVGWVNSATNLSPDGAYKYNTAVSNLTATNNAVINVYSLYSRNVTVSYNGNGATSGSTASETKTQYYNRPGSKATSPEFTVAANGFTKTGYAFTNWTNGSTSYAPGAKITPFTDQNVVTPFTLTAQWSQNKSTIKLGTMTNVTKVEYKEGANGTYKELTTAGFAANSNTDYYFKATLATASGYTITFTNFTGWFTDSANPSSAHRFTAGGQTYTVNAIASKVQNTATIKRGDITNVTKVYYSTDKTNWVELTTTGFTANSNTNYYFKADLVQATGYTVTFKTFGGWFTDTANPSSAHSFTEKGTYTVTASADKTIDTYTITYDLDGGTVSTANPTSYTVETATFTLNNPTKTGYTFTGWTGSNGTTAQTSVSIAKGTTGNKNYKANWSINKFDVTIVSNNTAYGTVDVAKVANVPYGSKVTVSGNTITVNGTKVTATATANTAQYTYAFSSWSVANNATITGATTITATFTRTVNNYTVTIAVGQSGYGTVSTTSVANVPYGTVIKVGSSANIIGVNGTNVTATPTTKTAQYTYTFNNWTSGSTTLSTTAGVTVTGATTITANFARTTNKYTATFDANGGTTPNPASITKEYNTEIGTLPTTTRANYVFNGWYTAKTNGTKITTTTKITGNVTYYAQWTSAQAKIGSNYFVTLGDAVTYANNNSTSSHTIELLVNTLTISSTLNINANVTIKEVSGITNATIKRNVTTATFNMFNVTAGKSLTISGNSKSDLITLDGQGGAGIYSLIANNGTLSVSYVKFYNNNALNTSNTAKPNVRGGAIHGLDGSTTSISNCTFDSNKANYGGALLFEVTAIISGISNSEFTNNTAYKYGGAVYLCAGTDIKFTSCKFTSNTLGGASGQMGDAFYIQLTNTTFDSCEFTSNTNKSYTIHIESSGISADNRYTVTFNNTTVSGSQLIHVNNVLDYKQEHLLTINGGTIANINIATTAKTYTPVYIGSSSTISKITFGQSSTLSSEASTKAIAFASSTLYNSMSSTIIANTTVPSGYSPVGDGSTAINCNKVYTITLNANGGLGGSVSPSTYTISSSAQTVTLTQPDSIDYGFVNWSFETNSSGVASTISGNVLTIKAGAYGNIKIKANWSPIVVKNDTKGIKYLENLGSGILQKAINEADEYDSLCYFVDITEDLTITKAITLYSGLGRTLTSTITINTPNGHESMFGSNYSAGPMKIIGTVKNLAGNVTFKNINMISDWEPCISNQSTGTIWIQSGTYQQSDKTANVIENIGGGTIQIDNGTLYAGYDLTTAGDGGAVIASTSGKIYINGGTLHAYNGIVLDEITDTDGVTHSQGISAVYVTGGTITGSAGSGTAGISMNGSFADTLKISGGTINNENEDKTIEYGVYLYGGQITLSADVPLDVFFARLDTDASYSNTRLLIDSGVTITKDHTIAFNSNGTSSGVYYLYSSTSEATRDSMFEHVTLVDTYTGQKSPATQGRYTSGSNYYGMLYLGNVVNVTQRKAYLLLSDAVSGATAGDTLDIVSSLSESSEITISKNLTIYSSTGATFTGDITTSATTLNLGTADYAFNINGRLATPQTYTSGTINYVKGKLYYGSNNNSAVYIHHRTLNIGSGVTIQQALSASAIKLDGAGGSTLVMNGGEVYTGQAKYSPNGVAIELVAGSVIINDGDICGQYAIYCSQQDSSTGQVNINGGSLIGNYNAVYTKGIHVVVKTVSLSTMTSGAPIKVEGVGSGSAVTLSAIDKKQMGLATGPDFNINYKSTSQSRVPMTVDTTTGVTYNFQLANSLTGRVYLFKSTNKTYFDSFYNNMTIKFENGTEITSKGLESVTNGGTTTYYCVAYICDVINLIENIAYTGSTALADALSEADETDVILIVKDQTSDTALTISEGITLACFENAKYTGDLDINITSQQSTTLWFDSFNQVGSITSKLTSCLVDITFDNSIITANNDTYALLATSNTSITINDGTKISNTGSGYAIKSVSASITMNGGEVFNGTSVADGSSKGSAIYHDEGGMAIYGGTVHGSYGYVQGNYSRGALKILNATISGVYNALKVCAMEVLVGEGAIIKRLSSGDSIMPIDLTGTAIIHLEANVTTFDGIDVEYRPTIDYPPLEVNTKVTKSYRFNLQQMGKNYVFSSTNKDYFDAMYSNAKYYYNYTTEITTKEIESVTSGSTTTYYCVVYIGDVVNLTQGTGYSSLSSAVSSATAGDTLMIMKALTYTSNINISKNLTLVSYNSSSILSATLVISAGTVIFGTSSYDYYGTNTISAGGSAQLAFNYAYIDGLNSNATVVALNSTGSVAVNYTSEIDNSKGGIALKLGDSSRKVSLITRGGIIGSTKSSVGIYMVNATVTITGTRYTGGTKILGKNAAITNYEYDSGSWSSANAVAGSSLTLYCPYFESSSTYGVLAKNMNITLQPLYAMTMYAPIAYYTTSSSYKITISETSTSINGSCTIQLVGEFSNKMITVTPDYSSTTAPISISSMTAGNNTYKLIVSYNSTGYKYTFSATTDALRTAMYQNLGSYKMTNVTDKSTGNFLITSFTNSGSGTNLYAYFYVGTATVKTTDGAHKYTSLQNAFNASLSSYDFTILSSSAGSAVLSNGTASVAPIVTLRTASGITHNGEITVYRYSHLKLVNYTASLSSSSNYMKVNSGGYLTIETGTTITSSYVGQAISNNGTLTMNGGTITSAVGILNNNILKMNGGTISVVSGATRMGVDNAGTFTMTGGYIHMTNVNSTTYGIYNESGASVTIGASTNSDNMPKIEPSFDDGAGYSIYNAGTKTSSSQAYPITFTGYTYSMIIYLYTLDSTYAAINITNLKGVVGYGDDWDVIRLNAYVTGYGYYNANATGVSDVMWVQAKYGGDAESLRTSTEGNSYFPSSNSLHSFDSDSKNTYAYSGIDSCFDSNSWVYVWDEKKKKIRRKRAKNITYKDKLLVWNFDKGCFDFANPMFIQKDAIINKYIEITFSDGSKLNVVNDHCVFNVDLGRFCPVVSDFVKYGCPVGSRVLKNDGTIVTVVSKKEIQKEISYTNIITKKHLNCYVNGILTSTPFNNVHKIESMKFVETDKHCENKALLDGIDEEIIKDFRLEEMPDKVLMTSPLHVAGCKTMKDYIDNKLANMKPKD